MAWIKCTEHSWGSVYVNFDRVIIVRKNGDQTILKFGIEGSNHLLVLEEPQILIERSESPFNTTS